MQRTRRAEAGRLLVVDDNKVNRLLLGHELERQGHRVAFAESGQQALDMLREKPFDLVMLDVIMPEMDGYAVLAELTSDHHLRHIPVIMTSAVDELDSVVRCIELGAEDYLPKPVKPVLLRARIGASLEKKRLRDEQQELISKFATSQVAEDLMESGFELGGKSVEATAMFSDIRSFTTITESQTPAETIELLNTYYTLMFEAISGHGGVVNQMVGDGLMAIFGAPAPQADRQEQSVRAALEMIELVEMLNLDRAAQNKVIIRIGVGVASGELIAGYTGTQHRATNTSVGDAVNLAARLEAHTKQAGRPNLIDAPTRAGQSPSLQVEDLGLVNLKGKQQAVNVFAVPAGQ
jgi:class 3 adenylate cyclase